MVEYVLSEARPRDEDVDNMFSLCLSFQGVRYDCIGQGDSAPTALVREASLRRIVARAKGHSRRKSSRIRGKGNRIDSHKQAF